MEEAVRKKSGNFDQHMNSEGHKIASDKASCFIQTHQRALIFVLDYQNS